MARLAAFARSDSGRMYATVCERWGVDPAAGISDGVLAYNLRAALAVATAPEVAEPDEWEQAAAENERIWLGG